MPDYSEPPRYRSDQVAPRTPGRRVYIAVVTFYVALFFGLIWPIYPAFARIEPRVLAMPYSLVYVVGGLLLSFFVLLGLYLIEHGGDRGEPPSEEAR